MILDKKEINIKLNKQIWQLANKHQKRKIDPPEIDWLKDIKKLDVALKYIDEAEKVSPYLYRAIKTVARTYVKYHYHQKLEFFFSNQSMFTPEDFTVKIARKYIATSAEDNKLLSSFLHARTDVVNSFQTYVDKVTHLKNIVAMMQEHYTIAQICELTGMSLIDMRRLVAFTPALNKRPYKVQSDYLRRVEGIDGETLVWNMLDTVEELLKGLSTVGVGREKLFVVDDVVDLKDRVRCLKEQFFSEVRWSEVRDHIWETIDSHRRYVG